MSASVAPGEEQQKLKEGGGDESKKEAPAAAPEQDEDIVEDRHCTDILCLALYGGALFLFWTLFSLGLANGQPERLLSVYDSSNQSCGIDVVGKPYLYFPVPLPDSMNVSTCVTACPGGDPLPDVLDCNVNVAVPTCRSSMSFENTDWREILVNGAEMPALFIVYNTTVFMDRLCFPAGEVQETIKAQIGSLSDTMSVDEGGAEGGESSQSTLQSYVQSVIESWRVIAGCVGFAILFGVVFMFFTQLFAGVIVWGVILLYFYVMLMLTYYFYNKFRGMQDEFNATTAAGGVTETTQKDIDTFKYLAYAFAGLTVASFVGLMCMLRDVRLAIAVVKTATQYVRATLSALAVPIVMAVFVLAWWALWLPGFVYLYAWGDFSRSEYGPFAHVTHTRTVEGYLWAYVFIGLWTNALIQAIGLFVLCSAPCIWYFGGGGASGDGAPSNAHLPVLRSLYRAFRYHFGSLAFGAFLLALVQLVRLLLEYARQQAKQLGADENNKAVKYILMCLQFYVECFERFIEFLNRNAYIQIAISGESFCAAALKAFKFILGNPARFALVSGIGAVFVLFGKLFILVATIGVCYLILTGAEPYKSTVTNPVFPLIIIGIIVYAVAQLFMFVYGMAVDAIFMCFLYDEERAKAKGGQAKYCPDTLREFIDDYDKKG